MQNIILQLNFYTIFMLCEPYNLCKHPQETLLECLRNKFKKERSPLVNLATVQEMKKKFGAKRQRVMDHVPLEDPLGHQVPFLRLMLVFSPSVCLFVCLSAC